ncbi:MAG: hypothetical protein ACRDST_11095 [Pseudonocardiaceae bacterium]
MITGLVGLASYIHRPGFAFTMPHALRTVLTAEHDRHRGLAPS